MLKDVKKLFWNVSLTVKMMWTVSVLAFVTRQNVFRVSKVIVRGIFQFWPFNILECPCEIGCPDGCEDCQNPVCECEVKWTIMCYTKFQISFQDLETNQDWNICIDDNGATLGRCIYACDDNESCETDCVNSFKIRQTNCPCEVWTQLFFRIKFIL